MKKILLTSIVLYLIILSSCKKEEGANPYDPNTKITVSEMPKITSFEPIEGRTGDTIIITGINFIGATSVSFGGKSAASFTVVSKERIDAVVGIGSSGTVSVTNAKGSKSLAGFTYIAPIPPVETGNLALDKLATSSTPIDQANRPPESRGNDGNASSAWFANG